MIRGGREDEALGAPPLPTARPPLRSLHAAQPVAHVHPLLTPTMQMTLVLRTMGDYHSFECFVGCGAPRVSVVDDRRAGLASPLT